MKEEIITLGNNIEPPVVNPRVASAVYDCVRTDEFEVGTFNGLLLVIVTYLDEHEVEFGNKSLPWAEALESE